jgi:hypothetical protein
MAEMLDWCGKSFRVERRATKACVDVEPPEHGNRRFPGDDVVLLDAPRCDGAAHDGCRRRCKVFWKEAWLRPAGVGAPPPSLPLGHEELAARTRKMEDERRYFCQSTQLRRATAPFPGNQKAWRIRVAARELRDGDRTLREMAGFTGVWLKFKALRRIHGPDWLRGPHERAPIVALGLQPGERVRIKGPDEMVATLDRHRGNRGMRICAEMTRCGGAEGIVRERVDRMIIERTGEMREIRNTVSLRDVRGPGMTGEGQCFCYGELGDCPRGELMYWREAWLERLDPPAGGGGLIPGAGGALAARDSESTMRLRSHVADRSRSGRRPSPGGGRARPGGS